MSSDTPPPDLDRLIQAVRASTKYQTVVEPLIRRVGADELTKRPRLKEAIKATKNKLHQIGAAYLGGKMPYDDWLAHLRTVADDPDAWRQACRTIMAAHASTRERLPILHEFYVTLLGDLGPVRSVLDVACGLNPLAVPWMPLAPDATYIAVDIFTDMMSFLNDFLLLAGVRGGALAQDIIQAPPSPAVDVALVLKTLPVLEQVDKNAALRLLSGLRARHIVVSYPVRSLGGHHRGMVASYTAHFEALIATLDCSYRQYIFKDELAFVISV
jgi:16S rRNA (guanine(1405)-N(7))-methyltransferase